MKFRFPYREELKLRIGDWQLKAVIESVVICLVALFLSFIFRPQDPFFVSSNFPWIWIAPVFITLLYGTGLGLLGVALFLVAWSGGSMANMPGFSLFPSEQFMGSILLLLICSEFYTIWSVKNRRLEESDIYMEEKLLRLISDYYLLKSSHDKLEQFVVSRPSTLRDALAKLKDAIREHFFGNDTATAPKILLDLLSLHCQVVSAGIYDISSKAISTLSLSDENLDMNDPLVKYVIENEKTAHINLDNIKDSYSNYLIVAPIFGLRDELSSFLVIKEMPFFALHEENLQVITVLASYYSMCFQDTIKSISILTNYPDCPPSFAAELVKLFGVWQKSGVDSYICGTIFATKDSSVADDVYKMRRRLDETWVIETKESKIIVTLMPLADTNGANGYFERISRWLKEEHGLAFDGKHADFVMMPLASKSALDTLNTFLKRCLSSE